MRKDTVYPTYTINKFLGNIFQNREIHVLEDKVKETIESVKSQEYIIKDVEVAYQANLERHRNKERELVEAKTKLEKLITDKSQLVEKVGDGE